MKIPAVTFCWPVLLGLLLANCARPVAPEGGPKDTTPPRVDSLRSSPNFAVRSSPRRVDLVFDEWVVLKDAPTQVVVSPPLAKRPEVTLRGHTVTLKFDKEEVLRANTTYTINFGSAVQDLHENNPAKDLRFVFATGDFLDSLSVRGSVADAFTGDFVDNVAVMLYENLADSAVQKERPYYFARTDKAGQFLIQNVKAGTFRLVAVEDLGVQNLRWDPAGERIGFPDTLLQLSDTARGFLTLKIFKETPRQRLLERNVSRYGRIKLVFAGPPDSIVTPLADTAGIRLLTERFEDTLFVWYDRDTPGAWNLLVGADTVPVRNLSREDFLKNNRVAWGDVVASGAGRKRPNQPAAVSAPVVSKTVSLVAARPALLPFNSPPAAFDTMRWLLMVDDSVRVSNFSITPDTASPRRLVLRYPWLAGKRYQLNLLPGAVTDFFGTANADTLARTFLIFSEKQLGTLALTVQSLRPGVAYVVQILEGSNVETERRFTPGAGEERLVFPNLPAVAYTVRIIEDRNANGRWDSGNFAQRRQPEPVFLRKLEPLRANWEMEIPMDLSAKKSIDKKK